MLLKRFLLLMFLPLCFAQTQDSGIIGKVFASNEDTTPVEGDWISGATVEIRSEVMPRPRFAQTNSKGEFRINGLVPGTYAVSVSFTGFESSKTKVVVELGKNTEIHIRLEPERFIGGFLVQVTLRESFANTTELSSHLNQELFRALPVGNDYRDLVKLAPSVQVSQDLKRGPSAGGSGQDNVFLFDGVNVSLPMFGTLSAEPSSHDIDFVEVSRGGAQAVGFNRAGGISFNSISKSGTDKLKGEIRFQFQPKTLVSEPKQMGNLLAEEDKQWLMANIGGPLIAERLFFFASYQGPDSKRANRSNLYGEVPDYKSSRDEYFLKLTYQPLVDLRLNASVRRSERSIRAEGVGSETDAGSSSNGADLVQNMGVLEGFWAFDGANSLAWKLNKFDFKSKGRPDLDLGLLSATDGSRNLDVAALDRQGLFMVPRPNGNPDFDAFVAPLIQRYGFLRDGVREGGGEVGAAEQINDQEFRRASFEINYSHFADLGNSEHEIHVGYQSYKDQEDLMRGSNGWGLISVIGGLDPARPNAYFQARFSEVSEINRIHSEFHSQNLEFNDNIKWGAFQINLGLLMSRDELYGQGLAKDDSNLSGFRLAPGERYLMQVVDWKKQIQPRVGLLWRMSETISLFANWSRYNPAVSSLPRAASWARNLTSRRVDAYFDQNGQFLSYSVVGSSSGKFFQEGLEPRTTDESLMGFQSKIHESLSYRGVARYKYSSHFWEDTNNNARALFGNTPELRAQPDYIPELAAYRAEVGGSSFVIAQLEGGFTKYYALENELEWRSPSDQIVLNGSYTWSHYYGNVDQDNTTTENDANIFVGSSNLADDAGRQIWDLKYGNLRGDRRHQAKFYGTFRLQGYGNLGFFAFYQSGQPWESWDRFSYGSAIGSSTSDVIRFSEPAGSRRTAAHSQLDLNYRKQWQLGKSYQTEIRLDVYNLFNSQTGYNIQPSVNLADYGEARTYWEPRRLQLALALTF